MDRRSPLEYNATLLMHRPQAGYLLLAWTVSILMLFHGYAKITKGVDSGIAILEGAGLPGFLAYGLYIGEILAPVLVLSGFFVMPAALVMAFNMAVVVVAAQLPNLLALNPNTGGYALEVEAFLFFGSLAIAFMAPGRGYKLHGSSQA